MTAEAVLLLALFLLPATAACGYYALGTVLGLFPHRVAPRLPSHRIAVLIPAHDEETMLPRVLASLATADYPADLLEIWVVADHCSDGTERVARDFGVKCLVRANADGRGKGYALEFGLSAILSTQPDAVLIVDADCRVSPGLLKRFDAELAAGAAVLQCAVVSVCDPRNPISVIAAVGATLDNRMAAAADRLGAFVPLRGTGMLFTRGVLERLPWTTAGLAEDAEYAAGLRRLGIPIRFVAGESVSCEAPPQEEAFLGQRRRWRASLRVPQAGRWFASKPVILTHLLLTLTVTLIAGEAWAIAWALAMMGITVAIHGDAMLRVGVRWPGFRSFWLIGRLALVALGSLWSRETRWLRTPR